MKFVGFLEEFEMQYVYAAMLLHAAKQPINEEHVKKVLHAAGAQADESQVKALVASLQNVNIEDAIAKAAMPVAAAPAAAAPAGEHKAEKKEDKQAEAKAEESASAGLGALFG